MATSVLLLILLVCFAFFFPRGAPTALGASLAANLALGWLPNGDAGSRVAFVGVCCVAGGVWGPRFLRSKTSLGLALVAVLAAYAVSMLVEPASLSFAPMGPELTSRFFGVSNLLESLLLAPALIGARLLAARFGPVAFAAVGALALATIAENQLGSDGGGAIVVGVAFALLAVQMIGARRRYTLPALGLAALVVLGLVNLDAAASGPDHLRGAIHGGFTGLANVAANRVPLAYSRMLEQWWLVFPGAAAAASVAAALAWLAPPGTDLAAHAYQRTLFLEHGFTLWNNYWYAGRYSFVTYSVFYYPLAALLGIRLLAVATIALAALAFAVVLGREWGSTVRWSSRTFAVVWAGVVLSAAFPFALGMALALLAIWALQAGARWRFAALATLTLLASPLAFLLLVVVLAGVALARREALQGNWVPVAGVVVAGLLEVAIWRIFPGGGRFPFSRSEFAAGVAFCVSGFVLTWRIDNARVLR